jgi:hypothetical protein
MKTLRQLAQEIQRNPDQCYELLGSFRTTSKEVRDFLFAMQGTPVYLIPALIETFSLKHRESDPKTVGELMNSKGHIGSIFVLVEDGSDWHYVGSSLDGHPLCRPFNSELVMELDPSKEIKYVF